MKCNNMNCKYYHKAEKAKYIDGFNISSSGFCKKGFCVVQQRKNKRNK